MAGRRSKNSSGFEGDLVPYKNGLLLKNTSAGNKNKSKIQTNDFFKGAIGDNILADWTKFKGGDDEDIDNYETTDYVERTDFANH